VIPIYAKYQTYLYIAVIAFFIGYGAASMQGGAGLQRLRVRTERYEKLYRTYQARESAVTKRLKELQDQLGASRRAAAELGESIGRANQRTQVALGRAKRVGDAIEGLAGIIRTIESRGPKQDPETGNPTQSGFDYRNSGGFLVKP
jgi:hypothetical protein